MKIKYLGTAAAEGIPAPFCECDACKEARSKKGKYIRSRSQALIDGKLVIDFNADTFMHAVNNDIDFTNVASVLITHSHYDHLYPSELLNRMPGFAHHNGPEKLNFYGSRAVQDVMLPHLMKDNVPISYASFTLLSPFDRVDVEGYTVSALPANHDPNSGPYIYLIEKDGKALLYGHDTGYYKEEVWKWLSDNNIRLDLVSLDCTEANRKIDYDAHCNLERDINIKARLTESGIADDKTVFILNHFSHNGLNVGYDEFKELAKPYGFEVSYDGMEVEI